MLSTGWVLPEINSEQDRHPFLAEDTFKKMNFFPNKIMIDCDICHDGDKHITIIKDREKKCYFS